jgi:hypothetical protein
MIEQIVTTVKLAAAERLSEDIGRLQREHGLTFSEAVEALRMALDGAHTDSEFPGGGYIVIT